METNKFFAYWWGYEDTPDEGIVINCYGLDENNDSVMLRILGFKPYIYVELGLEKWTQTILKSISQKWKEKYANSIDTIKFVKKKKLYYNHKSLAKDDNGNPIWADTLYPFLYVSFNKKNAIYGFEKDMRYNYYIDCIQKKIKVKIHENNASPVLQYVCQQDLPTANWIEFKGKLVPKDSQVSSCDYEYRCQAQNLHRVKDYNVVPDACIMAFDIEANSTNPDKMPNAKLSGDKLFQISCCIGRVGDKEPRKNILITLGKVNPTLLDPTLKVYECEHEGQVLLRFTRIIQKYNPQIITGYNIFSFDIPYMIERSKMCNIFYDFTIQGYTEACAIEKEIKWSSTAYKNQNFKYLDAQGRLYVDMLPIIQRDYKLDNYKLKTVSDLFIGETKDPLTAKDIFKCYRLGTRVNKSSKDDQIAKNAISIVGKYCVQDSVLVFKLFNNLQTWVGLVEMATTCNVPIFTLYTQGQQIKVFSQIYKECLAKNYVVEKDGYIAKDDEKLTGAIVLDPIPGIYDKITPFDFTSLYPTTIIAYNLCFSTLVKDDDPVDDKYCHVIDINEHKNCIAEGQLVCIEGASMPIEKLYNTQSVLSFNEEDLHLEYINSTRWYNQGKRECIKLDFNNGRSLTCTMDHRILNQSSKWIEAGLLKKGEHVKCGLMYPPIDTSLDVFDFYIDDDLSFTTKTQKEANRFAAFCRLLGYINIRVNELYQYVCRTRSKMDILSVIKDVKLVTGEDVEYKFDGVQYTVYMPLKFHNNVLHNFYSNNVPLFLLRKECPSLLTREFIAGLFSCNEFYPNIISEVCTGLSVVPKQQSSWLRVVLQQQFNIETAVENNCPISSRSSLSRTFSSTTLHITDPKSVIDFYNKIGYRYNSAKQFRLDLIQTYLTTHPRPHTKRWFPSFFAPKHTFEKFIKEIGVYTFEEEYYDTIPTYYAKLTQVTFVGERHVYDISVPQNTSFVCNGIIVHNCEHDTTTVKKDIKNVTCQDYRYRFLKEPKGIVPTLLEDLLNARKHTRSQQKDIKKQMDAVTGEKKNELQLLYNVLEKRQLAYKVSANSVYGAYGTRKGYLPFLPGAQCTTALGRMNILRAGRYIQDHYKAKLVYGDSVTGNTPILFKLDDDSIDIKEIQHIGRTWVPYEQFEGGGSEKEQCFIREPIQVWTTSGWRLIKRIVRHKTNKKLYNVLTPQGFITVTEDHSLLQHGTMTPVTPNTVQDMALKLYHDWPIDVYEFDVTHGTVKEGAKEFTESDAYLFGMLAGCHITTTKGSELEIASSNIQALDILVRDYPHLQRKNIITVITRDEPFIEFYKKCVHKSGVPHCVLNADYTIKNKYIDGFLTINNDVLLCTTLLQAQGMYYLYRSLGINQLTLVKVDQGIIIQQVYTPNVYTHVGECNGIGSDFVYDIETEDGTFHAGVGELVVKNTDSVYVNFPEQSQGSFEHLWDFCEQVETEINSLFIKPMHLSFESAIYDRFFILTKKRYICLKADRHGKIADKLMIRGVLLTRRDNAPLIRDIYKKTIMSIFYKEDKQKIIDTIMEHIHKMFTRQHPLNVYIITKSIGEVSDYKIKPLAEDEKKREKRLKDLKCTENEYNARALPANIQLAEKMRRRGKLVSASQRIEYVVTNPKNHLAKQFNKIEDYEYAREHSDLVQIDPLYYLKLMSTSLDEVLYVGLKLNDMVTKQYKYRLLKHRMLEQLHEYFGNHYRIIHV